MTAAHIGQVELYLYNETTSEYTNMGDAGCAIVCMPETPPRFRLGCYKESDYLCTVDISTNNDKDQQLAMQGQGYVSFRDDQSRLWSMHFASDAEATTFAAQISVAMYGAANMPADRIICCDVTEGKRDKAIYGSDRVKVRYQSWVVGIEDGAPKLGSRLEGNELDEKPYVFTVPNNHNSVADSMLGFEGMVVGMREEGRRFIVVPQNAKRGRGPAVHTVHMIYVVKKKDTFDNEGRAPTNGASTTNNNGHNQQHNISSSNGMNSGMNSDMQQQQQQRSNSNSDPQRSSHVDPMTYGRDLAMIAAATTGAFAHAHAPPAAQQGTVVAAQPVVQQPIVVHEPQPRTVVRVEQPPEALPPPPPAGFNLEQMETIQRLQDQVGNIATSIREVMGGVDMFHHDFKENERKVKPPSLMAAQMDHSLRTLMSEVDEMKSDLQKKDDELKSREERHRQLAAKAEKFDRTARQLMEDKKATLAQSGETKVDMDQHLLSLESKLTRVLAEREDVARHVATLKQLTANADQDVRSVEQQLNVAEVQLTTTESQLAMITENLTEEQARRKLLEAKSVTLGDELRTFVAEFRDKTSQIDDRRRTIETDRLHYTQLMEDERQQGSSETKEIRMALEDELRQRAARYDEDRKRAAAESFERGRVEGIEAGEKEEQLEADNKLIALSLEIQRYTSELETVRIKERQQREQAAADQRRLEAQNAALARVIDEVSAQNMTMETQLHGLETTTDMIATTVYDDVKKAILGLSRPIGREDLLALLHSIRVQQQPDLTFEAIRQNDVEARLAQERDETVVWVGQCLRATIDPTAGNAYALPPPMRELAPQKPLQQPIAEAEEAPSAAEERGPSAITEAVLNEPSSVDMAELERRQQELIAQLHQHNPALELVPPPPPSPPPQPVVEAAPVAEEPIGAEEAEPLLDGAERPEAEEQHADEEAVQGDAAPTTSEVAGQAEASESHEEEEQEEVEAETRGATATTGDDDAHPQEDVTPPSQPEATETPAEQEFEQEEDEEAAVEQQPAAAPPMPTAPAKATAATSLWDDSETDNSSPAFRPPARPPAKNPSRPAATALVEDSETDNSAPAFRPPAKAAVSKSAAPRHRTMFDSDGSDSASDAGPKRAPAAPAAKAPGKRAPPSATLFGGGDSEESSDGGGFAVARPKAPAGMGGKKKAPVAAPPRASMFADDSDDSDAGSAAPPARAPAKKAPRPAPKARPGLFDSEEEDD